MIVSMSGAILTMNLVPDSLRLRMTSRTVLWLQLASPYGSDLDINGLKTERPAGMRALLDSGKGSWQHLYRKQFIR